MSSHLVHEELFWVCFAKLAVLSNLPGHPQAKAALVVVLVDVMHVLQVVGVVAVHAVELVTKLALVFTLVDLRVNRLYPSVSLSITVQRR